MNNFSPGMKSIMFPLKEPSLAQKLRKGVSLTTKPQPAEEGAGKEEETNLIASNSEQDLACVGRESLLDDWFCNEARTSRMEKTLVQNRNRISHGDSGGSDDQLVRESRLKKPQVEIKVSNVEIEELKETVINVTNHNLNFKPVPFLE